MYLLADPVVFVCRQQVFDTDSAKQDVLHVTLGASTCQPLDLRTDALQPKEVKMDGNKSDRGETFQAVLFQKQSISVRG